MAADISMHVNDMDDTSDSVEMDFDEALLPRADPTAVVTEERMTGPSYNVIPHPRAAAADFSELLGGAKLHGHGNNHNKNGADHGNANADNDADLENLAELVPDIKARRGAPGDPDGPLAGAPVTSPSSTPKVLDDSGNGEGEAVEVVDTAVAVNSRPHHQSENQRRITMNSTVNDNLVHRVDSLHVQQSMDEPNNNSNNNFNIQKPTHHTTAGTGARAEDHHHRRHRTGPADSNSFDDDGDCTGSDQAIDDNEEDVTKMPKEFVNNSTNVGAASSAQSISTATQTHEVRMPMYLPTFKPATGCTNASDFIVRCFVARLRCGITVVKHGRSRWCKSRLRILHIHPDGRSLSWKPAEGEPTSSKRPPKLDLSTCLEVRHAWSPDPHNPMYTGTPILRQKCEAANAHKSFALIFKQRTVDITAVTADQCKVLMEGFSALCFRLQVANLASGAKGKSAHARPMPEEDGVSTTASNTLTNNSNRRP